jgi:serine/threonine protein kinase
VRHAPGRCTRWRCPAPSSKCTIARLASDDVKIRSSGSSKALGVTGRAAYKTTHGKTAIIALLFRRAVHTSITSRSIGKYQVVDRIGVGGMGEVFRARQTGEGGFVKYIALKSLLPQRSYDTEYLRRFLQEAKIVGRLSHQNIVQVFDTFQEENIWYIAMELVDGHDLGNLLLRCAASREPIPQVWIAHVLAEALRGLDHAHKKTDEAGRPFGIVHRDISPENILISYEGSVKVTDFGVAKGFQQPTGAYLVGKPRYMSPEQARGGPIDGRADVYSTGVVLWEAMAMTAAAVAGDAWNPADYEPPGIGQPFPAIPGTPTPLVAAIAKATKAQPDERYPDAEAFAADLRRFVAKEMPDFSPLDLGRFIAEKFADEHTLRLSNLRKFEEGTEVIETKPVGSTQISQKRRNSIAPPSRGDGAIGISGTPSPTVVARTPSPVERLDSAVAAAKPGPGTDLVIRQFKDARRRRLAIMGGVLGAAVAIGSVVYAVQSHRSTALPPEMPTSLPPVLPVLEPPTARPSEGHATGTPATPSAEDEDTIDTGDDESAKPDAPTKNPGVSTPAEERNDHHAAAKKLVALAIESVPEGASIRVNGKAIPHRTPTTVKGIPIGHRLSVELSLTGFVPEERQVVAADGANSVHIAMRPLEGLIRIDGLPAGARVVLDGQPTMVNPIQARPGRHRIDVSASGYLPASREVNVGPGQVLNVPMSIAAVPTGPGTLEVRCRPFCKLIVDGKDKGVVENGTPSEVKLEAGDHHVEARQVQSSRRKSQRVTLKSGETTSVAFDLSD